MALAVSMIQLPPYVKAVRLVKRAEALAALRRHHDAANVLESALEIVPSSKRIRIGLAIEYFLSPDEPDRAKGLHALEGVTLDKDEWAKVRAAMPAEYLRYFTPGKD